MTAINFTREIAAIEDNAAAITAACRSLPGSPSATARIVTGGRSKWVELLVKTGTDTSRSTRRAICDAIAHINSNTRIVFVP